MSLEWARRYVAESAAVISSLDPILPEVVGVAELLRNVVASGGTIYSCGNGGSARDAAHLTEELVARYLRERPGVRAAHFGDSGTMTCWSNDYDFDGVYERHVRTMMTPRDALVVFSTSGNSENIIRALRAAREIGAPTVGLLGKGGGKSLSLCSLPLVVNSVITAHIQQAHITLVHILCDLLENALFPVK